MKVTFIQPYYHNVWDVLGLGYIIAYCKKYYEGELEINFFQGKFDDHVTILRGCIDSDIVAFSCTSPAYAHGLHLAKCIKNINPDVHTVFGGWHPTALPEEVIKEPCVDQVITGEGEWWFLQILRNQSFAQHGIIGGNKILPLELPWPDREAIKCERTIDLSEKMTGLRMASFQAHRGCPFQCPFCAEKFMTGKYHKTDNPIRTRGISDVLDEIAVVKTKYDIGYFKFVDPTFDTSAEYVIDFCKQKIERKNSLRWEALIHASLATEEMFYWLKKAQCNQVNIGCESGSDAILRDIKKGLSTDVIKKVFGWAKKHGVGRRAFFLLGMPNETREDLALTEKLIDEIQPDVVGFTILCPYPGTEFYDHEKYKDVDFTGVGEYGNDIWRSKELTNSQLKNWQHYFTEKYSDIICEAQKI